MNVFRPGDHATYLERDWIIADFAGTMVGLYDSDTNERLSVSVAKLAETNPAQDRLYRRITELSLAETDGLRSGAGQDRQAGILKDVDRRLADVQEVALGKPQGVRSYREGYGPGSSQWSRAGLKQAELQALSEQLRRRDPELAKKVQMSRSTLFRLANAYLLDGPVCLLDGRRTRNHRVTDGVDPKVLETCARLNRELLHQARVSRKQRVATVRARLEAMHEQEFAIPGDSRLLRLLDELSNGMYLDGDAANKRSAANAPDRVFGSHPALLPGARMQVDSTRLDINLIFPDGSIQRPDAAFMSDQATRSVTAFALAKNLCGADLAFMIAQTMTPRPRYDVPPELKNNWEMKRRELPWIQMYDPQVRETLDAFVPLIRPRLIITDNGRNYTSRTVEAACRQLGITIVRAAPYTPTDKGIMERLLGSIKTMFLAKLPGFTGGSISSGGDVKPKREDLLTLSEFAWLLDRWLVHIWQNTPTEGLRDPRLGGGPLLSPNAEYAAMFPFVGFLPKPLSRNDYIGLLPMVRRTIQNDGVQFEYRMYDAPELGPLRRRTSGTALDGLWEVHYIPADSRTVWVYDPETEKYIDCEWKEDRLDRPFSKQIRDLARKIVEDGGVDTTFTSGNASINLIEAALHELKSRRKKQAANDVETALQESQRVKLPTGDTVRGPEVHPLEPADEPETYDDGPRGGYSNVNGALP